MHAVFTVTDRTHCRELELEKQFDSLCDWRLYRNWKVTTSLSRRKTSDWHANRWRKIQYILNYTSLFYTSMDNYIFNRKMVTERWISKLWTFLSERICWRFDWHENFCSSEHYILLLAERLIMAVVLIMNCMNCCRLVKTNAK